MKTFRNQASKVSFIVIYIISLVIFTGCWCPNDPFWGRDDAVYSPHGMVVFGDVALSPDGKYYATYDLSQGVLFGVYQNDNTLIAELPVAENNYIKAYCWSANSQFLAVMYHSGSEDGVYIYDAMTGEQYLVYLSMVTPPETLTRVPIDDFYHFLVFEEDSNNQLLAAISIDGRPGDTVRLDQFEVIYDPTAPQITLEPPNPISVLVGEAYDEPGVYAFDDVDGELIVKSNADDVVDTSVIGTYIITYTVEDLSGNIATTTRTVYVVDTVSPVVVISGDNPLILNVGDTFTDPGATATDNYDASVVVVSDGDSVVNTSLPDTYLITYTATDLSGNAGTATRKVVVSDITPPQITLLGSNPMYLPIGDLSGDPGATATDDVDSSPSITSDWDTVVDVNVVGTYVVSYTAVDSSSNSSVTTRDVLVEELGIFITEVPEYGTATHLYGRVTGMRPEDAGNYLVSVTIKVEGNWWTKPTFAWPTRSVNSDGTWWCDVVTGGSDRYATEYVAHLIPASFTPPVCGPCSQMPMYPESIDHKVFDRTPPPIMMTAFGYNWEVKNTDFRAGPGPNYFSVNSVWKDEFDRVHLAISYNTTNGRWESSEIMGVDSFGYKTYVVETTGRVDLLDPNMVFAPAFTWEDGSTVSGNRELDFEFALWGDASGSPIGTIGQYVVQPCNACPGCSNNCSRYSVNLTDADQDLTMYMVWAPGQVEFRTYYGHHLGSVPPASSLVHQWVSDSSDIPSPGNEKIHMNFWLMNGLAPVGGVGDEMIINNFAVYDNPPAWGNVSPVITILGDNPATAEAKNVYVDAGATALDDVDGDLTVQIQVTSTVDTNILGDAYMVTYTVSDSSSNSTTEVRLVSVVDTTSPVISLVSGNITVDVDVPYVDPGYTASDSMDGDLTNQVIANSVLQ